MSFILGTNEIHVAPPRAARIEIAPNAHGVWQCRTYNTEGDLVTKTDLSSPPCQNCPPPEGDSGRDVTSPYDYLQPNIKRAVSAILHAGFEHSDPLVREAREKLYAAVTYWPEVTP